ncbi:ACP S-malonyltransferase [Marinicella sp. S1101]|uniref:ACP S-malonyltransferase n=1 Tax=Marinicella marina TaxID=2996016 RepID=UPI0022609555|nr:ACP S-malonyltransferase [Marinicella marina]MCX7555034.1 ACP S-malonyltransferase [Marinicella marina]MDJ1141302.1 ACP S-malonyltransferase [Marinicella marina]
MNKIAFVFPGQGSQSVGMIDALADFSHVASHLRQAGDVLGVDLLKMVNEGPADELNKTEWTQPALLAVSVGVFAAVSAKKEVSIEVMAGHSLGEYSALVCAGSLAFNDAIALVHKRGLYMQEAVPAGTGSMAAVLGLDAALIEKACEDVVGTVSPANYNSPGQIVIAGEIKAVEEVSALCAQAGAKKVMPLAVSVPSHCELMKPAAEKLSADLAATDLVVPNIPILHNVDVQSHQDTTAIKDRLKQQLYQPVRWTQTMQSLQQMGITHIAECGPGKVLSGLFKRFDRALQVTPLLNAKGIESITSEE